MLSWEVSEEAVLKIHGSQTAQGLNVNPKTLKPVQLPQHKLKMCYVYSSELAPLHSGPFGIYWLVSRVTYCKAMCSNPLHELLWSGPDETRRRSVASLGTASKKPAWQHLWSEPPLIRQHPKLLMVSASIKGTPSRVGSWCPNTESLPPSHRTSTLVRFSFIQLTANHPTMTPSPLDRFHGTASR